MSCMEGLAVEGEGGSAVLDFLASVSPCRVRSGSAWLCPLAEWDFSRFLPLLVCPVCSLEGSCCAWELAPLTDPGTVVADMITLIILRHKAR